MFTKIYSLLLSQIDLQSHLNLCFKLEPGPARISRALSLFVLQKYISKKSSFLLFVNHQVFLNELLPKLLVRDL